MAGIDDIIFANRSQTCYIEAYTFSSALVSIAPDRADSAKPTLDHLLSPNQEPTSEYYWKEKN